MDLTQLSKQGALSPMDLHFAQTLGRLSGETRPEVLLAVAMAHQALSQGHVALDLAQPLLLQWNFQNRLQTLPLPAPPQLVTALANSPLVGPGLPLRLEEDLLYLSRYHDCQTRLTGQLLARAQAKPLGGVLQQRQGLEKHFGPDYTQNRQALAAANALNQAFCLVTGGPGTGKTTTAAKILALALELSPHPLACLVLAPTGKAAHRLGEALQTALPHLGLSPELAARFPQGAITLHRALEPVLGPGQQFERGPENLIPADFVLVDEASMIDLPLWTALLEALPPQCRVLLMGDPDQLSSVEAGAVLGDLVKAAQGGCSPSKNQQMQALGFASAPVVVSGAPCFGDVWTQLTHSHRFGESSEIGRLAKAVVQGQADEALDLLAKGKEISWSEPGKGYHGKLLERCSLGFAPYLAAKGVEEHLSRLGDFCLLTATKKHYYSAEWAGEQISAWLRHLGLITGGAKHHAKMPLLITANDHQQGLYNGDLGCLLPDPNQPGSELYAWFAGEPAARRLSPGLLPQAVPAWAMTTHKSQGSEWKQVALLLPLEDNPLLSRELIYTALTRAKEGFTLFGSRETATKAIRRLAGRSSGLTTALRRA